MRYLWDEVKALREWKVARLEADAIIGQDWSPAAIVGVKRELASLREEVHMLRDALAKVDPSASWETEPAHNSSDGASPVT
eukprot:COSAG01_NODE_4794_length_4740_cov_1.812756_3_plen_81_part_00